MPAGLVASSVTMVAVSLATEASAPLSAEILAKLDEAALLDYGLRFPCARALTMTIIGKAVEWATRGREQVCEACGATFTCGPLSKGGCWCSQEKISPESLEKIKGRYKRCLCLECLRKAAAGQ